MKRTPPVWYRLRWPRSVEPDHVTTAMRILNSIAGLPVILEARGSDGQVVHHIALPRTHCDMVIRQLRAAVPGLHLVEAASTGDRFKLVIDLRISTRRRPLPTIDPSIVSSGVLTALAAARPGEAAVVRWDLTAHVGPRVVPSKPQLGHESFLKALVSAPLGPPPALDAEARAALKAKRSAPGWHVVGRLAVTAASDTRTSALAEHVLGALRTAEGPGVRLLARRSSRSRLEAARRPFGASMLNVVELPAMAGWPVGHASSLPIEQARSRLLAATKAIATRGRVIGECTSPDRPAAVALRPADALRHLHVLGPTGVGKSTLLLNLAVQDMAAGRGVVVIEPKGDLIADVLARVPDHRRDDVVLVDPTDADAVVGLNPLAALGRSPELAADQLLAVFHSLYAASWGPRTQDILHASLLTLARRPGSTLVDLPLLLTDPAFRRRVVGQLDEPVVLQPFWAGFDSWSEAQRSEAIAPVMNKVRPFLLRANLRCVLGQAEPRFAVRQVFSERKIVLVNLAKGVMGSEAAALLGSLVVAQLWQATLERGRIEPGQRHPVFVFIDEFQDYLHLPTDLADALAAARGLGVGLILAHQHLHQLRSEMRSAVLANARSRVCFQLAAEDARLIAGGSPGIDADDLQHLDAFEIYVQLVAEGSVQPWLSARTYAAVAPTSSPADVRRRSRKRYGRSRADVEHAIRAARRPEAPARDIGISRPKGGTA